MKKSVPGADLGDLRFSNTTGILWFIGVEVERETNAPPPKKNPGSAPVFSVFEYHLSRNKSLCNRTIP